MMVLMGMTVNGAAKELNGGRRRRNQGGIDERETETVSVLRSETEIRKGNT